MVSRLHSVVVAAVAIVAALVSAPLGAAPVVSLARAIVVVSAVANIC